MTDDSRAALDVPVFARCDAPEATCERRAWRSVRDSRIRVDIFSVSQETPCVPVERGCDGQVEVAVRLFGSARAFRGEAGRVGPGKRITSGVDVRRDARAGSRSGERVTTQEPLQAQVILPRTEVSTAWSARSDRSTSI